MGVGDRDSKNRSKIAAFAHRRVRDNVGNALGALLSSYAYYLTRVGGVGAVCVCDHGVCVCGAGVVCGNHGLGGPRESETLRGKRGRSRVGRMKLRKEKR
jgi:hypothetical protein